MSLASIEASMLAAAKAEWARIDAEGIVIVQEFEADAETAFEKLATDLGPLVMQTISSLATAEFASLSGGEKANLAATTIVDKAAQQGIALAAADATTLIDTGFKQFAAAAPILVPAPLAEGAVEAGEKIVEGAVEGAAASAEAKVDPPAA